jgi:cation transport ATPase
MLGIDAAWSQGVLLLGGAWTIDDLSKLTHVVMDKTGTLTEGRLQVRRVDSTSFSGRKDLFYRLIAAAEREEAQCHPVGGAVFQWALSNMGEDDKRLQSTTAIRNFDSCPGKGISCEVEGHPDAWYSIHVDSPSFLLEKHISLPSETTHTANASTTSVHFAINGMLAGTLHLQGVIRHEAHAVISTLQSLA